MPGFVVLEGVEGSGKSSLAQSLSKWSEELGQKTVVTREPGATKIGASIRELILSKETKDLDPLAELLLFSADRAQHIAQLIKPNLEQRNLVISDRFIHSTIAYQGYGRGLDRNTLDQLNKLVISDVYPDLILLLDIDPEASLNRVRKRTADGSLDRMEDQEISFHHRVRDGFLELAEQDSKTFVKIDASKSMDEVLEEAKKAILNRGLVSA